ncbi:MAG TPA: hypothetical protein VGL81_09680 [Polyangiaceae bacterium]|jgi:hypothetical protein
MILRLHLLAAAFLLASLSAVGLVGCSGDIAATPASDGGGGGRDGGAATGDAGVTVGDGGTCVDIDPASYDVSCQVDTDCVSIVAGPLCPGYTCACPGGGAINASSEAQYQAALESIQEGSGILCECPAFPGPQCLGGVCTVCAGLPADPPACHSTPPDAGPDAAVCVDVDLSTYDQSCQTSDDCIGITAGVLCPGSCECGGAAVNISEQLRYQTTIAELGMSVGGCPCPAPGPIGCVQNKCTVCGYGAGQPAGCPDGG